MTYQYVSSFCGCSVGGVNSYGRFRVMGRGGGEEEEGRERERGRGRE